MPHASCRAAYYFATPFSFHSPFPHASASSESHRSKSRGSDDVVDARRCSCCGEERTSRKVDKITDDGRAFLVHSLRGWIDAVQSIAVSSAGDLSMFPPRSSRRLWDEVGWV